MRSSVDDVAAPLRAMAVALGVIVGVIDTQDVNEFVLALLCLAIGGGLVFAFRTDAGPVCRRWRRHRRHAPDAVFWAYSHIGPWLWRFGVGLACGVAARPMFL